MLFFNFASFSLSSSALLLVLPATVTGHSWLQFIGNGVQRGGNIGPDDDLTRYFCPSETLAECTSHLERAPTVHLTEDNLRPCRTSPLSDPKAVAQAGSEVSLKWAGNGHAGNGQSAGTCVKIFITPFAIDPSYEDFQKNELASCLPFDPNGKTEGSFTLPASLPAGEYTVLWTWDFAPFAFSSCADMTVTSDSGSAQPETTAAPATNIMSTSAPATEASAPSSETETSQDQNTSSQESTSAPSGDAQADYRANGCANLADNAQFCQGRRGGKSYCKVDPADQRDDCGRSVCEGDNFLALEPCHP